MEAKRTLDNESADEGAIKRFRQEDVAMGTGDDLILKLLIPGVLTGAVIGKQGSVLKQIMDDSGARCRVSLVDEVIPVSGERIVTILGSIDAISRAQRLISAQLADAASSKPGEEPKPADAERTLKIFVPNQAAGVVIGKAGSVIKELMERSAAQIRVSQPNEVIQACGERVVTVTGSQPVIDIAQQLISERLAAAPPGQQPRQIDYACLKGLPTARGPPPGGGYGAPPPSYGHGGYGAPPPAPSAAPLEYASFVATLPPSMPAQEQLHHYQEYLRTFAERAHANSYQQQQQQNPYQQPPPGYQQRQPSRGPPSVGGAGGGGSSRQIPLSDRFIAGIIGKGGSIIRDLAARSGAIVRVSQRDQVNAAGERTVIIEGSAETVAVGEALVNERIRAIEQELQQRAPGGGGGGGMAGGGGGGGGGGGSSYGGAPYSYQPAPAYGGPGLGGPGHAASQGYQQQQQPSWQQPQQPQQPPYQPPPQPAYQQPPPGYSFAP